MHGSSVREPEGAAQGDAVREKRRTGSLNYVGIFGKIRFLRNESTCQSVG